MSRSRSHTSFGERGVDDGDNCHLEAQMRLVWKQFSAGRRQDASNDLRQGKGAEHSGEAERTLLRICGRLHQLLGDSSTPWKAGNLLCYIGLFHNAAYYEFDLWIKKKPKKAKII